MVEKLWELSFYSIVLNNSGINEKNEKIPKTVIIIIQTYIA